MYIIQPVVLCGGQGLRLYPLSTTEVPKQLVPLGNSQTLLHYTLLRIQILRDTCESLGYTMNKPLLVMNKNNVLPASLRDNDIIYETYANDTAVAVAHAATTISSRYPNEHIIMLTLPADHYIHNVSNFIRDIICGIETVTHNNIVLYGISPISPDTKYGYIIRSESGVSFIEKPDKEKAQQLLTDNALWNSGIFAASIDVVLATLQASKYDIMSWLSSPRGDKAPSFDVAVLQEYAAITAHVCDEWNWSDVGTWDAFLQIPEIQAEMNYMTIQSKCDNVKVLNRDDMNIVVIGCSNLLIANYNNNLLVMDTSTDHHSTLKTVASNLV